MSVRFTKLFSSITESAIWCEPSDTRIVWITMLAMADKNGQVQGSIPGLANRAQVSVKNVKVALTLFKRPDKHNINTDNEGQRIIDINGGWEMLNYGRYRNLQRAEELKEYKRKWIKNKRDAAKSSKNAKASGLNI